LGEEVKVAGGRTLATQLESTKHSEEGRTTVPRKIRQMIPQPARRQNGENTAEARAASSL